MHRDVDGKRPFSKKAEGKKRQERKKKKNPNIRIGEGEGGKRGADSLSGEERGGKEKNCVTSMVVGWGDESEGTYETKRKKVKDDSCRSDVWKKFGKGGGGSLGPVEKKATILVRLRRGRAREKSGKKKDFLTKRGELFPPEKTAGNSHRMRVNERRCAMHKYYVGGRGGWCGGGKGEGGDGA